MRDLLEKNPLLEKVSAGKAPVGFFNYLRDTAVLGIAETVGFDFVVIDNEYIGVGRGTAERLVLAAELSQIVPFVHAPEPTPCLMRNYMEMDARGVLVPHIRSRAECRMAQEAFRCPLYGSAGCCRFNHADGLEAKNWMKYLDHVQELMFVPMIEDLEAVGHLDEILDRLKPGRDMVMFGKADYGQACGSLNTGGALTSEVNEAYLKVMKRCRARNIGFIVCPSAGPARQTTADVKKVIEERCSAMVLNTDQLTLAAALGNTVSLCLALDMKK